MKTFDEVVLLATRFHTLTAQELIAYVVEAAKLPKKTIVGNVNVQAMNLACALPWYRRFLNQADLVFCDGFGVLLGAKLHGYAVQSVHRMTCPDYLEALALACEREGVSLFLLAGKTGVVDKAIGKLKAIAPTLDMQGHHGFFEKTGRENERVIAQINQFHPGVLYIGFGMPAQEQWIVDNIDRLQTHVFLPLGACLDFYTNTVYRGPRWMTDHGLEWLSRLFTEPRRLWKRCLVGNCLFFSRVFVDYVRQRLSRHGSNH